MKLWVDDKVGMPADYDIHVRTCRDAIEVISWIDVELVSFGNNGAVLADYFKQETLFDNFYKINWEIHAKDSDVAMYIYNAMKEADSNWDENEKGDYLDV